MLGKVGHLNCQDINTKYTLIHLLLLGLSTLFYFLHKHFFFSIMFLIIMFLNNSWKQHFHLACAYIVLSTWHKFWLKTEKKPLNGNQIQISCDNQIWQDLIRVMVLSATFNIISDLLEEETEVPGENYQPVASHWQTLSLIRHYILRWILSYFSQWHKTKTNKLFKESCNDHWSRVLVTFVPQFSWRRLFRGRG